MVGPIERIYNDDVTESTLISKDHVQPMGLEFSKDRSVTQAELNITASDTFPHRSLFVSLRKNIACL